MESVNSQLGKKMSEEKRLLRRETDLVAHVERLEAQLQNMMAARDEEAKRKAAAATATTAADQSQEGVAAAAASSEAIEIAAELEQLRQNHEELEKTTGQITEERDRLRDELQLLVRKTVNCGGHAWDCNGDWYDSHGDWDRGGCAANL